VVDTIDSTQVEEALSAEVREEVIALVTAERVAEPPPLVIGRDPLDPARSEGDAVLLAV
jgi:hypothetical protein